MARFYRIKFNSIYLSADGVSFTSPSKLEVVGADTLLSPFTGSVVQSVDGTPVQQVFQNGNKGKTLEFRVATHLTKGVWDSIIALLNSALENSQTVNLVGIGDLGNFNVQAVPLLPRPFEAQDFENGRILKPIFRFITV